MSNSSLQRTCRYTLVALVIVVIASVFFIAKNKSVARENHRRMFETTVDQADQSLTDARSYMATIYNAGAIPMEERSKAHLHCWSFFAKTSNISHSFHPASKAQLSAYGNFQKVTEETCMEIWWQRPESTQTITLTSDERLSLEFAMNYLERLQANLHAARQDPSWNRNPKQSWIRLLQQWDQTAYELELHRPWVKQE